MAQRKKSVAAGRGWSGAGPIDREGLKGALDAAELAFAKSATHSLVTALSLYQLNLASARQGKGAKDALDELGQIITNLKRVERPAERLDRSPGLATILGDRGAADQLRGLSKVRAVAERALEELKARPAPADPLNVLLGLIRDIWTDAGGDPKAYLFPESNSARTPPLVSFAIAALAALPDQDRPKITAKAVAERLARLEYPQPEE